MHKAYELISKQELQDIHSVGYVLKHKKSGANISIISNDDENKVFYIGFRTPPMDSTGVPHIIEHSVLCGSDKYPVKDPFVELVKGSLNTFLNAMTYPDKTVYPVASCNDKDFQNLMDVYMDAVLHPNIYKHPEIFMQEGWHYELEDIDEDITLNGVVYNEMKGAFSSPDGVLEREVFNSLFPDTTYHYESGGDPKCIPELTYEEFLEFHQKFYHPCNSYIYLYGNMNIDEKLEFLDNEYLSNYEKIEIDSSIGLQKAFEKPVEIRKSYPIASSEDTKDQTYLSYNFVVDQVLNQELYEAFDILDYALLNSPGAPIRKALLDAGIGKDIMGSYDSGTLQPMFSIIAKNANPEDQDRFLEVIKNTLEGQVENGIDKKALLAGINGSQFKFREADFGSFPKGLIYGLQSLDSWLYDETQPFMHLQEIKVLEGLKKKVDTDYFEQLIQKYLLDNTHTSIVMIEPEQGLTAIEEEKLKEELRKYKNTMSQQQLQDLIEQTKHLKEYQEESSPKEDLEKIPMLKRSDLRKEARELLIEEKNIDNTTVFHHNIFTNGIHYMNLIFDVNAIATEDLSYLSLLSKMLGLVDTKKYTYTDFTNEMNLLTGGISISLNVYPNNDDYDFKCEVRSKFLYDNLEDAANLIEEMLLHSDFSDEKRLYEIIAQNKSRLEMRMNSAGHTVASIRAMSYFSKPAWVSEKIAGIEYYRFICDLESNFEERKVDLVKKLKELLIRVFTPSNLCISSTGEEEVLVQVAKFLPEFKTHLFADCQKENEKQEIVLEKKNEGFKDASQIQYVCRAGNFCDAGFDYTGTMKILKVILGYDYFWINVRVKGGAYGCMDAFNRSGNMYFVSYRDPNLGKTNEIFDATPDYIKNFEADERDMTKYIIGTISDMDTPLTPSQQGLRAMAAYFTGVTFEDIQRERNEVIGATCEDIRKLAAPVEATLAQNNICVIGNENAVEDEKKLFNQVISLF